MNTHKPPAYLSKDAKAWYAQVATEFEFETEAEWSLLAQAAGCLDRITEARIAIQTHGLLVKTAADGFKPNPAANLERDNKILFSRLLRELSIRGGEDAPSPPKLIRGAR